MNTDYLYKYVDKILLWLPTSGSKIVFILAATFILLFVARWIANRICNSLVRHKDDNEFKKRVDTLSSVVNYIIKVFIILMSCMLILPEFGIKIAPILAAAGVVGLAVGFGAQSLVRDILSGFFILLEDQIRVGDWVLLAGNDGFVEKINLRMTVLRDLSGNVHYVRNGFIEIVTNMTKDFSCYVLEIGVAYREDVDEVINVIKQVDEELRHDPEYKDFINKPLEVLGLDRFDDSAVVIKARTTTKPIHQWRIGREFKRRIKKKFNEMNIEIPFPHLTLYAGEDKKGEAPPIRIASKSLPGLE